MLQVLCKGCGTTFNVKPNRVLRGWGKFCSKACQYGSMFKGKMMTCAVCKSPVYRTPKDLRGSRMKLFFCNKSCLAIWKNKNMPKGEQHPNWKGGEYAYRDKMLKANISPICFNCKLTDLRVLIVHHLDRNRRNNELSNLRWLCRNCHYLEHDVKTI